MIRRIVLMRPHEWLEEGWRTRSFSAAGGPLTTALASRGTQPVESFHPVRVIGRLASADARPRAAGYDYRFGGRLRTYAVVSEFEDEDAVERLKRDRRQDIVGIYADPHIRPFPAPYCGRTAVGGRKDVESQVGVPALRKARLTGKKVRIAVMDTGIDGRQVPVSGGWAPIKGYEPGSTPPDHGTMVAYDARIAAPDAEILDYALLQSTADGWTAFLSDAIAGYADLIQRRDADPRPLVVNNSWGMYDRSEDAPIGSPDNYSANPDHPFNQIVGSLVASGADVFFAAGNCGQPCPSGGCGVGDRGPGASIHGANSHGDAVTVAAITVDDRRLGYSSQGPGALASRKPDLAASSHFVGSGVYAFDSGTSAASPVAAGVAAALRQKLKDPARVTPAQLKGLLQRSARDVNGGGWDADLGYGVIHAGNALKALGARAGGMVRPRRPAPVGKVRQRARNTRRKGVRR